MAQSIAAIMIMILFMARFHTPGIKLGFPCEKECFRGIIPVRFAEGNQSGRKTGQPEREAGLMTGLEEQFVILLKVSLAVVLGGIIGLEREMIGKPTGMRTHMLIGGSSALFTSLGTVIVNYYGTVSCVGLVQADPVRVIQAIVLGISFIGAGTILQYQERRKVIYLTSAASILFTAAIGIAAALEQYLIAFGCVAAVWVINRGLRYFDKKVLKQRRTPTQTKDIPPE
jgi:putative Mg2+ transporter-C (MgtC) family protein